jgi:hypothetical protein
VVGDASAGGVEGWSGVGGRVGFVEGAEGGFARVGGEGAVVVVGN